MRRLSVALLCLILTMCGSTVCDEWTERVRQLAPAERAELDAYGARAGRGWILFSERVAQDCEVRARFSRFAGSVVRGVDAEPADAEAVRANAGQLVAALMNVWPTRGRDLPGSDGAFRHELSSLLVIPQVEAPAMRPLIAKILREDGIHSDAAYALITRPDPFFRAELRRLQSAPRSTEEELCVLAVLQLLGEDTRPELNRLDQREDLAPEVREAVRKLLGRHDAHQPPEWDDVIALAL